jgi:hypothetical protein
MRSMMLLGCVVAAAAGCETTQPGLVNCSPCKTHKTACPAPAAAPSAPSAAPAPGKPAVLPPSIKEVRMEDPEPRQFATATQVAAPAPAFIPTPTVAVNPPVQSPVVQQPAPTNPGDVLLIPRWVYVPYSPHNPSGPSKMPAHANQLPTSMPYVQAGDQMTVLPPMGANQTSAATAQQVAMMEQCLQQMKQLNQRMGDLEAKAAKPATVATPASAVAPAFAPVPPVVAPAAPVSQIPPAATALPNPPQMLPLPPPLNVPKIPPAK